jgi:transcriptional regulator with XRE-family HTH domain
MNVDSSSGSGDAAWSREADERDAPLPKVGPYPAGGLVRRARRIADLSQRELARRTGLSPSTVARIETGTLAPSLAVMQHILNAAELSLVVIDRDGHLVQPMRDVSDIRDGADRRYPSHLDTILDPRPGEWWADRYGLARPPETFHRDRARRDARRALSRWQVRVKLLRDVPPPPDLDARDRFIAEVREGMLCGPVSPPIPNDELDVDEWDPALLEELSPDDLDSDGSERTESRRRQELRDRIAESEP